MSERDPLDHFEANRNAYEVIEAKIHQTFDNFISAPRHDQRIALERAVTFSLLSAQTSIEYHENGYIGVIDTESDADEMAEILRDSGVNYCNNKAQYIFRNTVHADADRVIDELESGDYETALRSVIDEYKGVGMIKGAFSLALLGVPKMACIDTHTAQKADIDDDDVYSGVVPEKYMNQWREIESAFADLRDEVGHRFALQWVLFDSNRGGVTMHDAWFLSLPERVRPDAL